VPALCVDGVETCGVHESDVSLSNNLIMLDNDEGQATAFPLDDLEVKTVVVNRQHVLTNLGQHAFLDSAAAEVPVESGAEGAHAVNDLATARTETMLLTAERTENLLLDIFTESREDVA